VDGEHGFYCSSLNNALTTELRANSCSLHYNRTWHCIASNCASARIEVGLQAMLRLTNEGDGLLQL
jgi:hypothetical protein